MLMDKGNLIPLWAAPFPKTGVLNSERKLDVIGQASEGVFNLFALDFEVMFEVSFWTSLK